ncbi:MAG: hypothetical protein ACI8PZ_007287 [Myxococcota bacterium]
MTTEAPYISLADFAESFDQKAAEAPDWMFPPAAPPLPMDRLGLRFRVEDVLDTVVALQRAEWLQEGVFVGPRVMPEVHRDVLHAARVLRVAVPPAIVGGNVLRSQGAYGTDARAFVKLSAYFVQSASEAERRFVIGRSLGLIAAHQVTAYTLYNLLVDQSGLRAVARQNLGPVLELVLAPLSLGVRLALARWHRAADLSADRAGLLCCTDVAAAGRAMLRIALGTSPAVDPAEYVEQIRKAKDDSGPSRWAEILASNPWAHKRIHALELFARSEVYAAHLGLPPPPDALDKAELDRLTSTILGVS